MNFVIAVSWLELTPQMSNREFINNEPLKIMMQEITIYGRGGQGAVTAAELLAVAAFKDEKFSQAFGAFGPERRGAPVKSFCRIDDKFIQIRQHIYNPDIVIVLDPNLLNVIDVTEGTDENTMFIINSTEKPQLDVKHMCFVDATKVAMDIMQKNIVNTGMLGALVKATDIVTIKSLHEAIKERFNEKIAEKNIKLIDKVHEVCRI